MNLQNLEGTWDGFYTYAEGYSKEYQFIKEYFALELHVNGEILEEQLQTPILKNIFKSQPQ